MNNNRPKIDFGDVKHFFKHSRDAIEQAIIAFSSKNENESDMLMLPNLKIALDMNNRIIAEMELLANHIEEL